MQNLFDILIATIFFLGIVLFCFSVLVVIGLIAALHAIKKDTDQPWNDIE